MVDKLAAATNSVLVALLEILKYPDERLRQKTFPIERVDDEIRKLVADMTETMYAARGAGLAAIQVASDKRLYLIDAIIAGGKESDLPLVFINPEIIATDGTQEGEEGCLSFPTVFLQIARALKVTTRAQDLDGNVFEATGEGLYARAMQHELDHINGKLLIDFAGPVKRRIIRRKMERRDWENEQLDPEIDIDRTGAGRGSQSAL